MVLLGREEGRKSTLHWTEFICISLDIFALLSVIYKLTLLSLDLQDNLIKDKGAYYCGWIIPQSLQYSLEKILILFAISVSSVFPYMDQVEEKGIVSVHEHCPSLMSICPWVWPGESVRKIRKIRSLLFSPSPSEYFRNGL